MILVVDNHDSFTFNLAQLFGALGADCVVHRADSRPAHDLIELEPDAVVISPGPGHPRDATYSLTILRQVLGRVPVLGVCLGHQCLATLLGADVVPALRPVHGLASAVTHCGSHLFADLPSPIEVGRYHSLIVRNDSLPASTHVCARSTSGEVMAFVEPSANAYAVQFHPESFLTPNGAQIIRNFLHIVETDATVRRASPSPLS